MIQHCSDSTYICIINGNEVREHKISSKITLKYINDFIKEVTKDESLHNIKKTKKRIMHRRDANNFNTRKREEDFESKEDLDGMLSQKRSLIQEKEYLEMEIQGYLMCPLCKSVANMY